MKKLHLLLLAAVMAMPMGGHAQDIEYQITGLTTDDATTVTVFVNDNARQADSAKVINGRFEVRGKAPRGSLLTVMEGLRMLGVVIDGTPADINLSSYSISGSAENIAFGRLQHRVDSISARLMAMRENTLTNRRDTSLAAKKRYTEYQNAAEATRQAIIGEISAYARAHSEMVSPAYLIAVYSNIMQFSDLQTELDSTTAYYHHPILKPVISRFEALAKRQEGRRYTDMKMQSPDGKTVLLSQYIGHGHYSLIDFWASWCGPCIKEMPTIKAAYDRYHASKGFEVVGVSFDDNANHWREAIKKHGLAWPQMSDLKGQCGIARDVYGIGAIPANVLVSPEGVIVANDLRGEDLLKKLAEIYGE